MNEFVILIMFLLFFDLFYKLFKKLEFFRGLNYDQEHEYLKCVQMYGKQSPICQRFLTAFSPEMERVGYIYNKPNNNTLILFRRYDHNKRRYDYFYKEQSGRQRNVEEIETKYELNDGDEISITGYSYNFTVVLDTEGDGYGTQLYPNRGERQPVDYPTMEYRYQQPSIDLDRIPGTGIQTSSYNDPYIRPEKIGVLRLNTNRNTFYNLYEKELNSRRDQYYYFILDRNIPIKIETRGKIYDGDEISIPTKTGIYIFDK